ncbi:MAG: hypothetical protein H8E90_00090 [Anaerolineales bacterium]|nr:hypothetical protein [Anaerolineales bacterium]
MKFKELLSKYEWDDIGPVLVRLYQDQEKNLAGYRQVFETLRTIQPVETKMRLAIEDVLDEFAGEYYASVSGKDGTLMKDLIPPVPVDEEAGNREVSYGLELTDWAEWLDMEIEPETLSRYTEVDIIGHCLWEMTFFGYSEEDIKKTVEELERARESDEGLTLEDFEEELGL